MRVIIQFGRRESNLLIETIGSLANFLASRTAYIELLRSRDKAVHKEPLPLPFAELTADDGLRLGDIAGSGSLVVPSFWFESFFLITIVEAAPAAASRIAGVLDVQADALRLRNRRDRDGLVSEAQRLAASDLAVACGHCEYGAPASDRWWAVSPNAIALDQHVASTAGLNPRTIPNIEALARHFVVPPPPTCIGRVPRLSGCVGPALHARAWRLQSAIQALSWRLTEDFVTGRRNVRKIPSQIRRLAKQRMGST